MLANAPPVVPGYRQFMGFLFALVSGKVQALPLSPPVSADGTAHPDLTYLIVGNIFRELFALDREKVSPDAARRAGGLPQGLPAGGPGG